MRVSVAQFCPMLLSLDANLAKMETMCHGLDTDLIVFPELATCGYLFSSIEDAFSVAESMPEAKSYQMFSRIAMQQNTSIVYGFAELDKDKVYNSAALINPDGSYYVYRKIHLFDREKLFFSPGDIPFAVHEAKDGVKIGMMICFDWQFPEAARSLALAGAQIICHPTNLVLPWCQAAMKVRSLENRVYSITSNRTGNESNNEAEVSFTGCSQILSTIGDELAKLNATEEGIATVEIDANAAQNKRVTERNNAFTDRRPELYRL